jgi:hypothetical protein
MMGGIYELAEKVLESQEEFCSMGLVPFSSFL